jgi:hypothetical protein
MCHDELVELLTKRTGLRQAQADMVEIVMVSLSNY